MDDPIMWQILLQIALIVLNAVFACAEIAVISMNDNKLAQLAERGDKRAIRLAKLTSKPARFLATIQVAITLSGFLGSAFAADNFSDKLVQWLVSLGVTAPVATLDTVSVILITLILSYITLVFGELVPKRIAMKKAEQLALGMSAMVAFISKLFAPIVWVLTASTNVVLRLFGIDPNAVDEDVSEEEIRMMVDVGNQKGVIDLEEKEMINNIFEFDDLAVGEVMTHRTSIAAVNIKQPLMDVINIAIDKGFSRIPVFENDIDNIVGTIYVKDLLVFANSEKNIGECKIEDYIRSVIYAPESAECRILFNELKDKKTHMAVVVDGYGGTAGIVTMEDLLEAIVGNIQDEYDQEEEEIQLIENGTYSLDGAIEVEQVCKLFDIEITSEQHSETLAGLITNELGYIPEDNQTPTVEICGVEFTVTKVFERRIARVFAKRIEENQEIA